MVKRPINMRRLSCLGRLCRSDRVFARSRLHLPTGAVATTLEQTEITMEPEEGKTTSIWLLWSTLLRAMVSSGLSRAQQVLFLSSIALTPIQINYRSFRRKLLLELGLHGGRFLKNTKFMKIHIFTIQKNLKKITDIHEGITHMCVNFQGKIR